MNNISNTTVSIFDNYNDTTPKEINLLSFLTDAKYKEQVENIRSINDKSLRDKIKATLPAITPSGIFSPFRKDEFLQQHSGFIGIDIDKKENTNINNYNNLKSELCKIPYVAFCGLSVSGLGYFVLIPIKEPSKHKLYFAALTDAFKSMNIIIDKSCINVSRLRGASYDEYPYINSEAIIWDFLPLTKPSKPRSSIKYYNYNSNSNQSFVEKCINTIQSQSIDITGNYSDWFNILCAIANEFGESGRQYAHDISCFHPDYNTLETDKQFSECLKKSYNYSIATFFDYCKQHGIVYKENTASSFSPLSPAPPAPPPVHIPIQHTPNLLFKPELPITKSTPSKRNFSDDWSNEITELESFFKSATLPKQIKTSIGVIEDVQKFINAHLEYIKSNNGNITFLPYLVRLIELKAMLSDKILCN